MCAITLGTRINIVLEKLQQADLLSKESYKNILDLKRQDGLILAVENQLSLLAEY